MYNKRTGNPSRLLAVNPDRYARFGHQTFSILSGIILAKITNSSLIIPRYMYFSEKWNKHVLWSQSKYTTNVIKEPTIISYIGKNNPDRHGNLKWNFNQLTQIHECLDNIYLSEIPSLINLPFDQLPGKLLSVATTNDLGNDLRNVFSYFHKDCEPYISIHIRRGDVSPTTVTNKYTPNEFYEQLIMHLLDMPNSLDIRVISQSSTEWLQPLCGQADSLGRRLLLNEPIYNLGDPELSDFCTLVNSHIIFSAGSAFSELASIIGNPKKIFNVTRSKFSHHLSSCPINPDKDLTILRKILSL